MSSYNNEILIHSYLDKIQKLTIPTIDKGIDKQSHVASTAILEDSLTVSYKTDYLPN